VSKAIIAIFALMVLFLGCSLEAMAQVTIVRNKKGEYAGRYVRQGSVRLYYDRSGILISKDTIRGAITKHRKLSKGTLGYLSTRNQRLDE
jgi:hypothetical protein